jgi:hypothetical protein
MHGGTYPKHCGQRSFCCVLVVDGVMWQSNPGEDICEGVEALDLGWRWVTHAMDGDGGS